MPSIRSSASVARRCGLFLALSLFGGAAMAQSLPVTVSTSGNDAHFVIGSSALPLADVSLAFEEVRGLSAVGLGVTTETVDINDPELLARLPDPELMRLSPQLPLLITIQPPDAGGLAFRNAGAIELHTHELEYSPGSSYRLLKAPIGGKFEDITTGILKGSMRARGSYWGFSQFLIVADVRPTSRVIDAKIDRLRAGLADVPSYERIGFSMVLDMIEAAVAENDHTTALILIDVFATRARLSSGVLDNIWDAADEVNPAGALIAGANTLRFSVAYQRDFGE